MCPQQHYHESHKHSGVGIASTLAGSSSSQTATLQCYTGHRCLSPSFVSWQLDRLPCNLLPPNDRICTEAIHKPPHCRDSSINPCLHRICVALRLIWQQIRPFNWRLAIGGRNLGLTHRARFTSLHLFLVFSWFDSQSSPSNSPSPLMADVLKIAQSRFLMLCRFSPSATAASFSAPGRSCTSALTLQAISSPTKPVPPEESPLLMAGARTVAEVRFIML